MEDVRRQFRALCNVRPAGPASDVLLEAQNAFLQEETRTRGVEDVSLFSFTNRVALWQGDITRLSADAIVNACNAQLLGCFQPLHGCIDNVIHTWAGIQVRRDCDLRMKGGQLPTGDVVSTSAYNLPSRNIFHTVGPIVRDNAPSMSDAEALASCYRNSLDLANDMGLATIAFCCISTGVYGYPQDQAADVAVRTVREWVADHGSGPQVIFNVFLDRDWELYEHVLS